MTLQRTNVPPVAPADVAAPAAAPASGDGEVAALRQALALREAELDELRARLEGVTHRMEEDLRLAANVQRALLPPPMPHPRFDVAREFMPFREVGGDYYDVVALGPRRVVVAIGDVMGKGVAAALLAANLKASLHAQLQGGELEPRELVARVNRLFFEVSPRGRFATFFLGLCDPETATLQYVNAGHDYPFVVRADGRVEELTEGGTVLGLVEDSRYASGQVTLERDDLLVLYTDGVTDRTNCEGEAFGRERLKEAARTNRGDAARIALYTLLGEVQGWASGRPAEDDMTLVLAKRR